MRRLIDEAVAQRNVDVIDELAAGEFAQIAKRWVRPFQSAFPDFEMEIVELIAEGDTVVGHFKCSGTHRGEWLGVPGTGRRFESVDDDLHLSRAWREAGLGVRRRRQSGAAAPTRHQSISPLTRRGRAPAFTDCGRRVTRRRGTSRSFAHRRGFGRSAVSTRPSTQAVAASREQTHARPPQEIARAGATSLVLRRSARPQPDFERKTTGGPSSRTPVEIDDHALREERRVLAIDPGAVGGCRRRAGRVRNSTASSEVHSGG